MRNFILKYPYEVYGEQFTKENSYLIARWVYANGIFVKVLNHPKDNSITDMCIETPLGNKTIKPNGKYYVVKNLNAKEFYVIEKETFEKFYKEVENERI